MAPENPKLFAQCSHPKCKYCGDQLYCGAFGSDITLLDLFAGFAIAGRVGTDSARGNAKGAYKLAQAMLEERDKVKGEK